MLEQSNRSEVSALPEDFYTRIKDRLRERIGSELRSADWALELGCGSCELAGFLARKNGWMAKVKGQFISLAKLTIVSEL